MKREIERSAPLPIVRIDLAELSVLIDRLLAQFADPAQVRLTITIQIDKEKVSANSVAELREATDLPPRITRFDLTISEEHPRPNRHIIILSKPLGKGSPLVTAIGESEAWSAGAIETTKVFFARHRAPLYWAAPIPAGLLLLVASVAFLGAGSNSWKANHSIPWSWIAGYGSIVALSLVHARSAECQLVLRETESAFTRALPGLGFVVALASLVVAILAWLLPRAP